MQPQYHSSDPISNIITELTQLLGPTNVLTSKSILQQHGQDEGYHGNFLGHAVVTPQTTEQISKVMKICSNARVPVIPYGTGTGLEGGVLPIKGGICIDTHQMNQVLELHEEDYSVHVEAGLTHRTLNNHLRHSGVWFSVDPGADASLGGMASTSASGTNAVRYGTMRENTINLEVVLHDGTVINTAGSRMRARKTSAGYNLTNLFVGSEGTLGVITKLHLRLHATPDTMASAVCSFPSVESAVVTVIRTLQCGIPVARIEFLDEVAIIACNQFNNLNHKEVPTLFLEFHGSSSEVEEQSRAFGVLAAENGGSNFEWAKDFTERNRLWKARHNLYYACLALKQGQKAVVSDVCVPISKLPYLIIDTKKDICSLGLTGCSTVRSYYTRSYIRFMHLTELLHGAYLDNSSPVFGHVGDGNFHAVCLFDQCKDGELYNVKQFLDNLSRRALSLGGTCTGEHGIGMGKMHLLKEEIGTEGLEVMKTIKLTLDPFNIMNPGKVLML